MSASVFYDDPRAAIAWLCQAFGFEVRVLVEGDAGQIAHSQLILAEALIMVAGTTGKEPWQQTYRSPHSIAGGITQSLVFHVDDVDQHCEKALANGAKLVRELRTDDYGDEYWADRTYGATDPEGHLWWFLQRMRG